MPWTLTPTHEAQRNAAAQSAADAYTLALADASGNPSAASTLRLYDSADPEDRTLLATITLDKPCAEILEGGQIRFFQANPTGDMVSVSGVPVFAEWVSAGGEVLGTADAQDVQVSSREDGQIFAGGFITLVEPTE